MSSFETGYYFATIIFLVYNKYNWPIIETSFYWLYTEDLATITQEKTFSEVEQTTHTCAGEIGYVFLSTNLIL